MKAQRWLRLMLVISWLSVFLSACNEGAPERPTAQPAVTLSPAAAQPPAAQDTWLVMVYLDADDEILEEDIYLDLNEIEQAGGSERVTVVAQIDRYAGGYDGDGDWDSTKRFLLSQKDDDLKHLKAQELQELGELDMGNTQTLVDFGVWAIQSYPASKYALILSDHGAGWMGGWTDDDPQPDSSLKVNHIDEALAEIVQRTGIQRFDLVGFDACLMSQVEALSSLAPYADYAVASEETEPSVGWAYFSFLSQLLGRPEMDGAQLSQAIVNSYVDQDARLSDDVTRAALFDEPLTRQQAVAELGATLTLTAVDLRALGDLHAALNQLALALAGSDAKRVAEARAYTQAYDSVFGSRDPGSFIDLGHFTALLAESIQDERVSQAAAGVQAAIQKVVLVERHGPDRPGSSGLSIFFPTGNIYKQSAPEDADPNYTQDASRFAAASLWDDFLAFHYAGQPIDAGAADLSVLQTALPQQDFSKALNASTVSRDKTLVMPGAGEIEFEQLTAGATQIALGGALTLTAQIRGGNVGYIYLYTLYYDDESDSYVTLDMDFIDAGQTREIGGVTYPDWGEDENLDLEIEWQPVTRSLSDGKNEEFAPFESEIYGRSAKDRSYVVWGTYTPAGAKSGREAFLRFDGEGNFRTLVVLSGRDGRAARQVNMKKGDRFTITEEWLEYDNDPEGEFNDYDGGTLTYTGQRFEALQAEALPGQYVVGVIVEDLAGQQYEQFVEVTVK